MLKPLKWFTFERSVLLTLCSICLLMAAGFSIGLLKTYREYRQYRIREFVQEERVNDTRREIERQERYLNLLMHDPAFFERVVRQRLGYAKPQEFIFRFEEPSSP